MPRSDHVQISGDNEILSNSQKKWDERYLGLAQYISTWSQDPSTKVGAVIVDKDNRPVSFGFNGLPKGVIDSPERLNNRDVKYKMIVHAERNALLFAKTNLDECTLYTWPLQPCAACTAMIIQSGIKRVVSQYQNNERWLADFALSMEMFSEAGVTLELVE